jgi:regulator of replication initiation timing
MISELLEIQKAVIDLVSENGKLKVEIARLRGEIELLKFNDAVSRLGERK